jgi:membrane-bound metal-dependent hydrolase YbcI (DUF457 family)
MIFFGHLGLTLAASVSLTGAARAGAKHFLRKLDYRILLLGSMLPDLADKPVAFFFKDFFGGASRLYGHTLLFSVSLVLLGIFLWKRYKIPGWLVLAGGAAFHQFLDGMWNSPSTFLWPFLGWSFPAVERESYLRYLLEKLTDPYIYIPEAAGLFFLLCLALHLARKKQLAAFIRTGRLSAGPLNENRY